MIKRSFDLDLLLRATDIPEINTGPEMFTQWFHTPRNLMFADGENVGLATYEAPGVYTVHWYFKVRGRKAIQLGQEMLLNIFDNYGAKVARGYVKEGLKASRWAARQVGFKSYGMLTFPDGDVNELFIITKQDILNKLKDQTNG